MNKRKKHVDEFNEKYFRVAIFGSSRIKKDDPIYRQVKTLGRLLGERGVDIVTGGGPGLMKAANAGHQRGSRKTGAYSIGLNIKIPREQKYNKHLDVKKEFAIFSKRLDEFMNLSNAIVVAPGGVGTLLEFFYAWQLVQVEHICNTPIILMGNMWSGLLEWLEKQPMKRKYFTSSDVSSIFLADNCSEVMAIINKAQKAFDKGDKNFCVNSKKYGSRLGEFRI
jgi:uncharacterized protein (TIGR00730 family)